LLTLQVNGKSEIKRRSKYYLSAEQAQLFIKKNEQEVKKWIDELRPLVLQ
jgi:hypothetical protein